MADRVTITDLPGRRRADPRAVAALPPLPKPGAQRSALPEDAATPASLRHQATPARLPPVADRLTAVILSGPILAVLWAALCGAYFFGYLGWAQVMSLLPHEIGGLLAGAAMPLALLWLAGSYRQRMRDLGRVTEGLRQQLELLTYANPEAERRIGAVTDSLRHQAQLLVDASEQAAERVSSIGGIFQQHTSGLSQASEQAAAQARFVRETMQQQVDRMSELYERIKTQSAELEIALRQQATRAHEGDDLAGAIRLYRQVLDREPDDSQT